jgi:glycosyltransferase involved in cell wall biosynthesis
MDAIPGVSRHILIYTDDPDKGGVAQYNHVLSLGLVEAGHRVSIVQTESAGWRVQEQRRRGIRHHWISYDTARDFSRTITDTSDAEKTFTTLKPDLLVFSDCCPVSNIAARHVAIRMGVPYVIVVNFAAEYLAKRFQNCLPVLAGQYAKAREVIAVSTENKQLLHRSFGLPANKGRVVFYGVPPIFFEPMNDEHRLRLRRLHGIPDNAVVTLTAARLTLIKGHVFQLHAMELVRRHQPDTPLVSVWLGDGELRAALEAEIAKMNLRGRFVLAGNQDDVAAWYDAADFFTLTSSSEGMPISIMEAMAKSLPVVATGVSGVPEEIQGAGVLLPDPEKDPQGVVQQLAETWMQWTCDRSQREKRAKLSRARATEYFKLETCLSNTRRIFERAASA